VRDEQDVLAPDVVQQVLERRVERLGVTPVGSSCAGCKADLGDGQANVALTLMG
jgi:hypothetical protein